MKRVRRHLLYISLVALLLLGGCGDQSQPTSTPQASALLSSSGPLVQGGGAIKALGTVRSAQTLQLSFGARAPVKVVAVSLGTAVRAGDLLADLDATALLLDLESAEQEVAFWQAALDRLLNGASAADVERAEAEHAHQVAEAEIALQIAVQRLAQAQRQDGAAEVTITEAGARQAALRLAQARAGSPTAEVAIAQVDLVRAQDALAAAQDEYRKALDRPWEPQEVRNALAREVQRAEWNAAQAQARLVGAERAERAYALGVEAIAVQGDVAQTELALALDAQAAYSDTLGLLTAEVTLAERRLERLKAWTNPLLDPASAEEVAQARARLRQAELAVEQLRWQIDNAALRAPFDGLISAVHVAPGEWSAPGVPAIEVVDTTRWTVETRNVSELVIGRVQIGQKAAVQVLAISRALIGGTVAAISPVAVVQQGDTTYTLYIELEQTDLNLKPGMNVQLEIQTE